MGMAHTAFDWSVGSQCCDQCDVAAEPKNSLSFWGSAATALAGHVILINLIPGSFREVRSFSHAAGSHPSPNCHRKRYMLSPVCTLTKIPSALFQTAH